MCSGATGHAEVIRIGFDPSVVSFDDLLAVFWKKHDPTQLNRQGGDVGTQYRSCILAADDAQLSAAKASAEKEAARRGVKALATEIVPLTCYYRAEEYHQQYLVKGGRNGNAQSPAKMCNDPVVRPPQWILVCAERCAYSRAIQYACRRGVTGNRPRGDDAGSCERGLP